MKRIWEELTRKRELHVPLPLPGLFIANVVIEWDYLMLIWVPALWIALGYTPRLLP